LTSTPCYDQAGGYSMVLTDPGDLAIVNAEIDLSNSTWSDPSTRLQNLYVPPSYFINGSWVSDGAAVTVTYRLVDSQGNELQSKSGTGPVDNLLNIHASVAKALAKSMCCNKSSKVKCAKTGSIDVNFTLYQPSYDCVCTFSEVGSISFSLQSANTDPNAACEYSGGGEASLTIDCPGCWCPSTVCPVAIGALGKVVSRSGFPCTGATLTFELSNAFGCNSLCWGATTITETDAFSYKEGAIVGWPGIIGGYTLHLK
jgi:hypothetical protein